MTQTTPPDAEIQDPQKQDTETQTVPPARMRVAVDLDGTICPIKRPDQTYADLEPLLGAVKRIRELRAAGHYVIIMTARNMATCQSNLGTVMKNVGKITLDWLERISAELRRCRLRHSTSFKSESPVKKSNCWRAR